MLAVCVFDEEADVFDIKQVRVSFKLLSVACLQIVVNDANHIILFHFQGLDCSGLLLHLHGETDVAALVQAF